MTGIRVQDSAANEVMAASAGTARSVLELAWVRFTIRRGRRLLVSLVVLATASFFMIHLIPGDPVRASLGLTASPELVAAKRKSLGLDHPLWIQYTDYLRNLVAGHWGTSMTTNVSVWDTVSTRLSATAEIAGLAFLVAVAVSVPLGTLMAVLTRGGRRRRTELAFASSTVLVAAIPDFLLATGLVWIFGVTLGWLPVAGRSGPSSFVLPVVALAAVPTSVLARIMRVEVLAVLQADYVRTARAKRLSPWRVYGRHALPNAMTTTLTVAGLLLGGLMAGTVLVENVMAWPGLGQEIVSSIVAKDYPMVQGIVVVYGIGVLVINLLVDIALALLDPRSTIRDS